LFKRLFISCELSILQRRHCFNRLAQRQGLRPVETCSSFRLIDASICRLLHSRKLCRHYQIKLLPPLDIGQVFFIRLHQVVRLNTQCLLQAFEPDLLDFTAGSNLQLNVVLVLSQVAFLEEVSSHLEHFEASLLLQHFHYHGECHEGNRASGEELELLAVFELRIEPFGTLLVAPLPDLKRLIFEL
jgi:hypothetical protein